MKREWHVPDVPSVVIALSGLLLGLAICIRFLASEYALDSAFGGSLLATAGVALTSAITLGLVVLKSIADRQSRMERDMFENFLDQIPVNVFFKDRKSRFIRISKAMAKHFGFASPAQSTSKTDADIFSSEHAAQALADETEIILTGRPMIGKEERETWPDGRETWVFTTKVPLRDHRNQIIGTMGAAQDITNLKLAEIQIHHMALHDALTGLPNRTLLKDRLAQAIALARRSQERVAVFMIDLDRFKQVNDLLGHHIGDLLLAAVSTRLKGCLRESDIVARLGGDEFVIAFPVVTGDREIQHVAQKVLDALGRTFEIEGHMLQIGASIGVCHFPADGTDPDALLQSADAAMYEAKAGGRGIYSSSDREVHETLGQIKLP